jgi:hypothetical protein
VRKRSCAVYTTWSSDDSAVQDERTNHFKCDDGDADDAHGSVESALEGRLSTILDIWSVYYICMYGLK